MLDRIIQLSIKHRLFVVATACFVFIYGMTTALHLPIDVFPDLNRPTVTILTESGGLAPEEVELLVTQPIERAMNGTPGLERVRSSSGPGLSVVYLEFGWGTEIFKNRQLIAERLSLIKDQLPRETTPIMGPISSIMGEIQLVGLTAEKPEISPMDLRTIADWTIRPRLLSIRGLSQVVPIGGGIKQYQILLSSEAMLRRNLGMAEVLDHLRQLSLNTTGGFIDVAAKELMIRNIGRVGSLEEIENTVVGHFQGQPVQVKEIAQVTLGPQTKRGDAGINGKPGVILSIQKQPGTSTIDLTAEISKTLQELQPTLPAGVTILPNLFRQADFIEHAITNVKEAIRDGSILIALILTLLLMNWRTTAITLTAIPLSFVVTAIIFQMFGLSINTMTLGGLAVAIGEVVDDATVDVENVFRRLGENRKSPHPKPALRVIYEASSEVRNSIVFATIVVALVFIPLFAMGGLEGRFFVPLGIAYVVSLVASLFVSLTVTPALCAYLLPNLKRFEEKGDSYLVRLMKRMDRSVLSRCLDHPRIVLLAGLILFVSSLCLIPFFGREFLPKFNEGSAVYNINLGPGVSLARSNELGTLAENVVKETPEVRSVSRRTGRAELDEHAEGVHSSELDVDFQDGGRPRTVVMEEIRKKLSEKITDGFVNSGQPISHRLDHLLSGVRAQIAIKVFGPDLIQLRSIANTVYSAIKDVPGAADLQIEQQVQIPQLKVRLIPEDAKRYNVVIGEMALQLEWALEGEVTAQILEEQRVFNVFMRLDDYSRGDIERIQNMPVKTMPDGTKVLLRQIADVYESDGPNMINRENLERRIVVQLNSSGRDLNSLVHEIQARVKKAVSLPAGYHLKYGGQFESERHASKMMLILGAFSILAVFIVLYSHFHSTFIALQIMLNIPMALIGSAFAVFLTDRSLSIASMVAFITLCGIASRNGIMMISHYLHLMRYEGERFTKEMVVRGSLERLVPVLSTALCSILGLIPLIASKGEPGKEILYPLGVVITGGLLSSTFLDMWVTPTVFYAFGRKSAEKYVRRTTEEGELTV